MRLIQDERDAEYFLGAPVVGLIPETLTPEERGRQRRLMLTRRLALLVLAVGSVPLLAILIISRVSSNKLHFGKSTAVFNVHHRKEREWEEFKTQWPGGK